MTKCRRVIGTAIALIAALGAATSAFAQTQHKMQLKVEPPKATVTPTGSWQPKSIAYIKASNTSKDQQFGGAIALSGDGNTLAVGRKRRRRGQRRQSRPQGQRQRSG